MAQPELPQWRAHDTSNSAKSKMTDCSMCEKIFAANSCKRTHAHRERERTHAKHGAINQSMIDQSINHTSTHALSVGAIVRRLSWQCSECRAALCSAPWTDVRLIIIQQRANARTSCAG